MLTINGSKTDKVLMKSIFFFSILFSAGSSLSNASVNNGFYDVEFSSSAPATSEVTTPVVESSMAPASAVSPPSRPENLTAASAAAAAPATPTRDYTVRSAGSRADGEALVNLRSCNSIVFISGQRSNRNRNNCDTLKTAGSFVETLMRQLPLCIAEGVRASGISKPIKNTKVYNAHSLRTTRQTSDCRSIHYKARALDIWGMDVTFEDGTNLYTKMHIDDRNRPFYKEFNKCWERETKAAMRREYPSSRRCHSYDGLIDCSRSDHRDHVHVSLPYCPKKTGYCSF